MRTAAAAVKFNDARDIAKDSASSKAVIKTRLRPGVEQGFSFMAREDVTAIVRSTPPYS